MAQASTFCDSNGVEPERGGKPYMKCDGWAAAALSVVGVDVFALQVVNM